MNTPRWQEMSREMRISIDAYGKSFVRVERDRSAGAIQLISDGKGFWKPIQQGFEPGNECQGLLIDFQLFMVEHGIHLGKGL